MINESAIIEQLKLSALRGAALGGQIQALLDIDHRAVGNSAGVLSSVLQYDAAYARAVRQGFNTVFLLPEVQDFRLETQEALLAHVALWTELIGAIGTLTFQRRIPNLTALVSRVPASQFISANRRGVAIGSVLEAVISGVEQYGVTFSSFWAVDVPVSAALGRLALVDYVLEEEYDFDVVQNWQILLTSAAPLVPNVEYIIGRINANISSLALYQHGTRVIPLVVEQGDTIEGIALRVMGSAERWLELAEFNNLRFPYISDSPEQFLESALGEQTLGAPTVIGEQEGTLLDMGLLIVGQRLALSQNGRRQTVTLTSLDTATGAFTITETWLYAFPTISAVVVLPPRGEDERGILSTGDTLLVPSGSLGSDAIIHDTFKDTSGVLRLYGTDIALSQGKLTATQGDLTLVSGVENLRQAINSRFQTRRGSMPYAPEMGTGIHDYLGWKNKPYFGFLAQIDVRETLKRDVRIASIKDLSGTVTGDTLKLSLGIVTGAHEQFPPFDLKIPLS